MLHPFFTKTTDQTRIEDCDDSLDNSSAKPAAKQQKDKELEKVRTTRQPTIGQLFNRGSAAEAGTIIEPAVSDDGHGKDEPPRCKRRRTSLQSFLSIECNGSDEKDQIRPPARSLEPQSLGRQNAKSQTLPHSSPHEDHMDVDLPTLDTANRPATPTKKMLRLNAKGRFSSPISKTAALPSDETITTKPKRRVRKSKNAEPEKHLVVILRYSVTPTGENVSVGPKIDQILAGELCVQVHKKPPSTKKPRTPRKQAKVSHPFFDGKKKAVKNIIISSPRKTATSTPGKLRLTARQEREEFPDPIVPASESALLKDRLMVKHAGAKEPLWPAKGMNHVRGEIPVMISLGGLPRRKQKHHLSRLQDSILSTFANSLQPEVEPKLRLDGFREPRADLHIPEKRLLCGSDIAKAILPEVKAPLLQGPDDELNQVSSQPVVHPALEHLFRSIPSYFSGFDNLRGEPMALSQKTAPQAVEQVLQPTKEINVIKQWLQSLAISSVDGRADTTANDSTMRRKKRKARPSDLNDFIVDEDDDVRSMGNISDGDAPGSQSMVQTQIAGLRASNTLLISGPHGCGKTAAIYAVAKELQYRVFEISSAERRAGKDVLDKIGNVTENHIVNGHSHDTDAEMSGTEDKARIDAAFNSDLESGRQGKMSAFFKPKAKSNHKASTAVKVKAVDKIKTAIGKAVKEQQQSLILLEEVDILFKEDKEFWTTILRLVQTSKRPFIMTCNDEDLVPMQAINLHAVLRLIPPPDDLAVDYLLLVAAREGHLLQRKAVKNLWHDCGQDLRQALTTLQFWCQMGVGDIRDGLGWIYQRWPPGSDLDSKGRALRIVSQNTYHSGMGSEPSRTEQDQFVLAETLNQAAHAAQSLSDIDVFSTTPSLDTTHPATPEKRLQHYIEGMVLLDAPVVPDFTGLREEIAETAIRYTHADASYGEPSDHAITRNAFAACDALAYPLSSTGTEWSVLDGPFSTIVTDIAPYIRQVIQYEATLRGHREALHGPLKKARKTRAARSALEGGQRQLTRREEWWEGSSSMGDVLRTAGPSWRYPLEVQDPPSSIEHD